METKTNIPRGRRECLLLAFLPMEPAGWGPGLGLTLELVCPFSTSILDTGLAWHVVSMSLPAELKAGGASRCECFRHIWGGWLLVGKSPSYSQPSFFPQRKLPASSGVCEWSEDCICINWSKNWLRFRSLHKRFWKASVHSQDASGPESGVRQGAQGFSGAHPALTQPWEQVCL